jgi:hypothetical protein
MEFVRDKLKENILIDKGEEKAQSEIYFPPNGETGVSTSEVNCTAIDSNDKTRYTFFLKNPNIFRGIACDIYIGQMNICFS